MTKVSIRIAAAAALIWSGSALAGDLGEHGAILDDVTVDAASVTVERGVALDGDVPSSTHVTAHTGSGAALQRTNLGYWIPWDGRLSSLVDNGFVASDDRIDFKVMKDEDMRGETFPIRVTIGYRVGDAFKFGVFEIRAAGAGGQ